MNKYSVFFGRVAASLLLTAVLLNPSSAWAQQATPTPTPSPTPSPTPTQCEPVPDEEGCDGNCSCATPTPAPTSAPATSATAACAVTISYYGYASDPYMDSNTKAGKCSIGKLKEGDIALSPDQEEALKKKGGRIGCRIKVTLKDGSSFTGRFSDRTHPKCKGRVDRYKPSGPRPNDGAGVASVDPA